MRIDREELARRVEAAEQAYAACSLCARRCAADRRNGPAGACQLGEGARLYKEYVHYGEEEVLVPSHTIFLTGCNLRCAFCTDDRFVRHTDLGRPVVPVELAATIARRRREGARNVNFVGGLPDVNVLAILRTLLCCPPDTHVVWNTNLYNTPELMGLLDGVVDTWLADLKFGNDACARRLSGVSGYCAALHRSLDEASRSGRLLVRHLVMPGHVSCCTRPALRHVAEHLPGATVNVMTSYVPYAAARRIAGMDRRATAEERSAAIEAARALGLRLFVNGREDGREAATA